MRKGIIALGWITAVFVNLAAGQADRAEPDTAYPIVLAHRGMTQFAPENSVAAIREALRIGADGSEIDVHLCKSGEVIVIHDYTVNRTTNGEGEVSDLTLEQLRALRLNPGPGGAHPDEMIPTLEEMFQTFGKSAILFIEMKRPQGMKDANDGLEEKVGALIDKHDLYDSTFVSSFNPTALARIKKAYPRIRTVYEYFGPSSGIPRDDFLAAAGPVFAVGPVTRIINDRLVRWARKRGLHLSTFSPRNLAEMERAAELGFDLITTNAPGIYKRMLAGALEEENTSKITPIFSLDFEEREMDSGIGDSVPVAVTDSMKFKRDDAAKGVRSLALNIPGEAAMYFDLPAKPDASYLVRFQMKILLEGEKPPSEKAQAFFCLVERHDEATASEIVYENRVAPNLDGLCFHRPPSFKPLPEQGTGNGWQSAMLAVRTTSKTRSFRFLIAGYEFDGTLLVDALTFRILD